MLSQECRYTSEWSTILLSTKMWLISELGCHQAITCSHDDQVPGGCFTNISRALQNDIVKIYNARNHIYGENFKLKYCYCAQSMALGTCTKFQLEILIRSVMFAIHKFWENILESLRNVSETPPGHHMAYTMSLVLNEWVEATIFNRAITLQTIYSLILVIRPSWMLAGRSGLPISMELWCRS